MFPNIPQLSHRLFWRCHHHRGRDCIGGGHCGGSHCAGHHCPGWPNHGVCHRRLSQMSGAWHHWRCKRCGCWDSHWCHRCTVQEMAWATGLQTVHHIAWSASDRRDPLEALPRDPIGRNGGCNAGHVHDFGHKVSRIGTPWHNAHDAGLRHLRTSRSLKQLQDVHSTYIFNQLQEVYMDQDFNWIQHKDLQSGHVTILFELAYFSTDNDNQTISQDTFVNCAYNYPPSRQANTQEIATVFHSVTTAKRQRFDKQFRGNTGYPITSSILYQFQCLTTPGKSCKLSAAVGYFASSQRLLAMEATTYIQLMSCVHVSCFHSETVSNSLFLRLWSQNCLTNHRKPPTISTIKKPIKTPLMSTDLSQATDLSCSVAPLIYPSPSDHHPSHPRTRWVLDGWPVSSNMASWKIHLL